jgi:hypothetical protein
MVMDVKPENHLVLIGAGTPVAVPEIVDVVPPEKYAASTWQWLLRPLDDGRRTRLVVRQRLTYSRAQTPIWRIVEPINFVMERKMLHGLKARAERDARPIARELRSQDPPTQWKPSTRLEF